MLNIIWPIFIIISIIYAALSGNMIEVNDGIFETLEETATVIISMGVIMCFWSGIINILEKTRFFNKIKTKFLNTISILFKGIDKNSEEGQCIAINIISNIFGLGNASTVAGIRAMECMDGKRGKSNLLSKSMMLFILINTASIQIIPTTVIAIRTSLGSSNPGRMIVHVWIASGLVFLFEAITGYCFFKEEKDG